MVWDGWDFDDLFMYEGEIKQSPKNKNMFLLQTGSDNRYEIDLAATTCTCPDFENRLSKYPPGDPRRLCKHQTRICFRYFVPGTLAAYTDDIRRCGEHGKSYVHKDRIKEPLAREAIKTLSVQVKRKYAYITAFAAGAVFELSMDIETSDTRFFINNKLAFCSPLRQVCELSTSQAYMKNAILEWLTEEYEKIKAKEEGQS